MDLEIDCEHLKFTVHGPTAPPAAVAALEQGILNARFVFQVDIESESWSLLQPDLAIMKSCGMLVPSVHQMISVYDDENWKFATLDLPRSTPKVIEVMKDVRRSADLPFTPAQLAQLLTDDCCVEHAIQQQAWHAEFLYKNICSSRFDLKGPNVLSVL